MRTYKNKKVIIEIFIKLIKQYQMKTVQSFFPTTAKQRSAFRKDNTYKVMKKLQDEEQNIQIQQSLAKPKLTERTRPDSAKIENIFRDRNRTMNNYSLDQNLQRPIGGMELFLKMEKCNNLNLEESTRRLSKKSSRKNIKQFRDKAMLSQPRSHPHVVTPQNHKISQEFKQQTFKQHTDGRQVCTVNSGNNIYGLKSIGKYLFQKKPSIRQSRKISTSQQKYRSFDKKYTGRFGNKNNINALAQSGLSTSVQSLRNASQTQKIHLEWASQQQKKYLDKMAILNEINYNKPLVQKIGNRYFQCSLRNRYLDEPEFNHMSPFIYQIKEKLSDTKFISKIISMKPNSIQRDKIVVKGRNKMIKQQQEKMQVKDGRKRWEEWNQESFQM